MTGIKQLCLALLMAATSPALAGEDAMLRAPAQSFKLPGDAGWDYVTYDPTQDRVFIGRSDGVQVVSEGRQASCDAKLACRRSWRSPGARSGSTGDERHEGEPAYRFYSVHPSEGRHRAPPGRARRSHV